MIDRVAKVLGSVYGEMISCFILKRGLSRRRALDWQRRLREAADELNELIK